MSQQRAPLAEQFNVLERIQELDLRIDSLRKEKSSQPSALKALDEAVAKAEAAANARKQDLDGTEKAFRQARAGLELNRDRLARSNQRLEGIQNAHEFEAVTREIEQLNRESKELEEKAAKAESDLAAAKAGLDALAAKADEAKAAKSSHASKLAGDSGKLDTEIAQLLSQRAAMTPSVEPRTIAAYDRVRAARGGLGVVPAEGGRCKGCNMAVPPQLFNEIRKMTAVHTCPSCHRLLFAKI